MRTPALLLLAATLAGCSTAEPPQPTPTPTPPPLYDEWAGRFDMLVKPDSEPRCADAKVRTKDCANYLAPISQTAAALEAAIKERPDAATYVDTLVAIRAMVDARDRYTDLGCPDGKGSLDACQGQMLAVSSGVSSVLARLKTDELKRR